MECYKQSLKFYAEKSPQQIYNLISIFNESMDYFIRSDPALTSSQWGRIDDMRKAIKNFKSTK